MHRRWLSLGPLILALGCSSEAGDAGHPGSGDGLLRAPPDGKGFQLELEVLVPSGVEGTWCQQFVLPAESHEIWRYESRYTPISHHLIAYQTTLAPADAVSGPFDCDAQDRMRGLSGFHYGTQSADDALEYPRGIGKRQLANEVVLVEYHAINTTGAEVPAVARVNFWYAEEPVHTIADTLFFYHPIIYIPPNNQATATMHCEIGNDVALLHAVPHMHRRGIGFEAMLVDPGGVELGSILQSDIFEPRTTSYDPPFEIRAGQAIDFTCHYRNDEARPILEGPSAVRNEMCVFAASFYSPKGELLDGPTRLCDGEGSGARMPGNRGCRETRACLDATRNLDESDPETAAERDRCAADACHTAYDTAQALASCRYENCRAECVDGNVEDAACAACVSAHCLELAEACDADVCG